MKSILKLTSCIETSRSDSWIIQVRAENIVQDLLLNLSVIGLFWHFVSSCEYVSPGPAIRTVHIRVLERGNISNWQDKNNQTPS